MVEACGGSECGVSYFPSFELLVDELRDYRWYGADMLHPSSGGRFGCSVVPLDAGTVMVMGGKGLRSCEALDTIDNSIEYEAAVEKTKKQQKAVANALLAEQEASKLVTESINLMPSLRR